MPSLQLSAGHALLRGLRRSGSETQLTQALAAVLAADPTMAADFVRLVLDHAPRRPTFDSSALPDEMLCQAEETLGEQGRADLIFTGDGEGGDWQVIVEIKVYAGYGHEQIRRYLESFGGGYERR